VVVGTSQPVVTPPVVNRGITFSNHSAV